MNPRAPTLRSIAFILGVAAVGLTGHFLLAFAGMAASAAVVAFSTWATLRREVDQKAVAEFKIAETLLEKGDHLAAVMAASKAASHARTSRTRNAALTTLAWAALAEGYVERAKAALESVEPPYRIDLHCYAAVQAADGRPELATKALELARASGSLGCEGAKLLVELYARQNQIARLRLRAIGRQIL
jgi:hypothetical protein